MNSKMSKLRTTGYGLRCLLASLSFLLCLALTAGASDGRKSPMAYSGFSGGMMLHTGYVSAGATGFDGKPTKQSIYVIKGKTDGSAAEFTQVVR